MKKYGMIVSSVFLLLVLICAARVFSADSKADKIRSEHPISTDFEENLSPASKEELFKAILKLAVWESETREALDKTYEYTDDDLEKPGMKYGLESTEELLENALKTKWYEQRMSLFDTTEKCINDWCDSSKSSSSSSKSSSSFDPDDHDIEAYYEDNRDVYDDYDDAYEGFLNDEVVWDDY